MLHNAQDSRKFFERNQSQTAVARSCARLTCRWEEKCFVKRKRKCIKIRATQSGCLFFIIFSFFRQALFGFAKGRTQLKTGRRLNLASHAKTALKGLPELDSRIWAHTAQDKTGWNNLCTAWSRDAPEFKIENMHECPICKTCFTNLY